jgi:hypothetical protein
MRFLALLLPLLFVTACGGGSGGGSGSGILEIVATDAPIDPSLVEAAMVEVVKVRIHASSDEDADSGWITLYDGAPVRISLMTLRNGITSLVASGRLSAGTYRQMRLHLSGGYLELTNGNVYSTDDGTLKMPSAMTSAGHKLFFNPPIVIPAGGREQIVLDFDLTKTFQPIPGNDPENASRYNLHPEIRAAVTSISGELRVTVRQDDGTGNLVGVPDAMVYVLPPGETDTANSVASSITDDTGSAAIIALLPGTYDVLADSGGVQGRVDGVVVMTGEASLVDIVLP